MTATPEMDALIRERVGSGRYAGEAAVLDEALRLLEERDKLEYVRALIDEADAEVERGELIDWTPDFMEQLMREDIEANRNSEPIDEHVLPSCSSRPPRATRCSGDPPVQPEDVGARSRPDLSGIARRCLSSSGFFPVTLAAGRRRASRTPYLWRGRTRYLVPCRRRRDRRPSRRPRAAGHLASFRPVIAVLSPILCR